MTTDQTSRRQFLRSLGATMGGVLIAGCDAVSRSPVTARIFSSAEILNRTLHHAIAPRKAMAPEYTEADLSPYFRSNGTDNPNSAEYQRLARSGFVDWRLQVDGSVDAPAELSLAQLRAMPSRTQITRHDCVEGWSAIGKWKGVPLSNVLALVRPRPAARYVVFHCADPMDESGTRYYESVDMEDAYHPQTILAYDLNDAVLPIANGAPVRVRIERQLGYKMAKYIMRIEVVESFSHIGRGKGGYWEDEGYEWYAGI